MKAKTFYIALPNGSFRKIAFNKVFIYQGEKWAVHHPIESRQMWAISHYNTGKLVFWPEEGKIGLLPAETVISLFKPMIKSSIKRMGYGNFRYKIDIQPILNR